MSTTDRTTQESIRRENQRIMLTRRLVKESLVRLLATQGIRQVSIRELCEQAGINRSTFYKHYGSQYDVLAEMEDEVIARISENLVEYQPSSDLDKLEAICSFAATNIEMVRMLTSNNVDPSFPGRLFGLPLIRSLIEQKLGEAYGEEHRLYISELLVNGCYSMLLRWLERENRMPARDFAHLLREMTGRIVQPTAHPLDSAHAEK